MLTSLRPTIPSAEEASMSAAKKYVAAKPFTTPHSRFAVGDSVAPSDITGPLSFKDWQDKGFIALAPEPAQDQASGGETLSRAAAD